MYIFLIIFYVGIFFILIPGIGAFTVRSRWRDFRKTLVSSLNFPLFHPERNNLDAIPAQEFRFFGTLEALQDNDLLWLQQDRTSVSVNLHHESVFVLPPDGTLDLQSPYSGTVQKVKWEKTGILAEGIGVFVFGSLGIESGMPRFSHKPGKDFLVIFFDGRPQGLLARAIWHGRQQNEYWNDYTPFSLLIGFVALLSLAFIGFQDESSRFLAVVSASFSLLPFLPLMPPGILLFFLYRYLWRRGRALRARKELVALGNQLMDSKAIREECGYAANPVNFAATRSAMANLTDFNLVIPLRRPGNRHDPLGVLFSAQYARDPMAFPLLVQGEPHSRVSLTVRFIRIFELSSLLMLGIGLVINFYSVLALIIKLINNAVIHP